MADKPLPPIVKRTGLTLLLVCLALGGYWLSQHYRQFLAPDAMLGAQIYERGITGNGDALQGVAQNDIAFKDPQFNCAQCHRRSGFGSSEGGNYVLPVTGNILFNPRTFDRADLFNKLFKESQGKMFWARMRSAYQRPAYSDESLAAAIRSGIDPSGRKLSSLMPRYQLTDTEMAALITYLHQLSNHNDPGVDDRVIRLATVVGPQVSNKNKDAMLATIAKFVAWLNLETEGNLAHPNFSPGYRSEFAKAFRLWQHEVWELPADPKQWADELAKRYQQQPVFAFIGGMAEGDWTPIHDFCENNRIPCLFPFTDLPPTGKDNHYSMYFNQGLILEAKAIGRFLRHQKTLDSRLIVNIHANDARGNQPAMALAQSLAGDKQHVVIDMPFETVQQLRDQWQTLTQQQAEPINAVIWPGKFDHAIAAEIPLMAQHSERLLLPAATLDAGNQFRAEIASKLYFSYPYELPSAYHPHAFRVRAWMNTQQLPIDNPRLQFNTYYALNLLQFGLEHVVDHFSRDYLLEYIETEAENLLNPGTFPRLSLGPGQRFASKGAYIVQLDNDPDQPFHPVSSWITP
ncbi:MAG: c-type cytochrome [Methylomonas sp.]|uniref:c-type cytochrome n=1 Tax=Methylomonas sp. TaxID=418 RepID=UPI0025E4C462|nr:c-type cytochrome [Methylomonas sp.]MCK9606657.1 c-type cytochrome [Methylomonas sp.]